MAKPAAVGPWAKEKLTVLDRYLRYYTKVLKNAPWRKIYFDAFAGGGRATIRRHQHSPTPLGELLAIEQAPESVEFIRGSPAVALEIPDRFDRYVFVDLDPARVAELNHLKSASPDPSAIEIRNESAEDAIRWLLRQRIDRRTHRGLAFLDPFGGHLPWAAVESLGRTRLFEVVINFPVHMALNRLMMRDPVEIPASWRQQLDDFFGGSAWMEIAYEEGSLFAAGLAKKPDAAELLLQYYSGKLQGAFGYVSKPRLIRNTVGGPLYYLLWAGPHRAGLKGAEYIMKMAD